MSILELALALALHALLAVAVLCVVWLMAPVLIPGLSAMEQAALAAYYRAQAQQIAVRQ